MKINRVKFDNLILLLLMLMVTQFYNMQVYWSFGLIILFICIQIFPSGRLYILPITQWLVLVITYIAYFYTFSQNNTVGLFRYMTYLIGPPMFYYCGMVYVRYTKEEQIYSKLENVMLVLSIGGALYAASCIIFKYTHYDTYLSLMLSEDIVESMQSRYALDIWSGNLFQPTNLNSYCIFATLSLYPALRFVKEMRKKRMFFFTVILAIVVCLESASRTNLLFLILAYILGVLLTGDIGKKKGIFSFTRKKLIGVFIIVFLALIFSDQIASFLKNTTLGSRLGTQNLAVSTDGRWERMGVIFSHLMDYPNGNMPYSEAHNLWLDTARVSGLLPMVLIIIYTLGVVINAVRFYRKKWIPVELRTWMVLIICIMFMSFMIEPVLEGRPYIFILFCFFAGMLQEMIKVIT